MPRAAFVVGIPQAKAALRGAGQRALRAGLRGLLRGVISIEGEANRRAPVAFGDLRASITHTAPAPAGPGVFAATAGTAKSYAPFVEFGTGPAGAAGLGKLVESAREAMAELGYVHGPRGGWPPDDVLLAWMRRKGISEDLLFPIQRAIRRQGTEAQPFLFPAYEAKRPEIAAGIERDVKEALERG